MVVRCTHLSATVSLLVSPQLGEMVIDEPVLSLPSWTSASTMPFEHALTLRSLWMPRQAAYTLSVPLDPSQEEHKMGSTGWIFKLRKKCQTCSFTAEYLNCCSCSLVLGALCLVEPDHRSVAVSGPQPFTLRRVQCTRAHHWKKTWHTQANLVAVSLYLRVAIMNKFSEKGGNE